MKFLRFIPIVTLLLVLLLPAAVNAHGAIFTYKYIDGDNLILVTHNVHDAQAGAPVTYNLRLYTMEGQVTNFEAAEVKVSRGKDILRTQKVTATDYNDANFSYAYPKKGNYTLSLTFLDHDKNVSHGEFPIVVADGATSGFWDKAFTLQTVVAFLIGGVVGVVGYLQRKRFTWIMKRLKKLRKK